MKLLFFVKIKRKPTYCEVKKHVTWLTERYTWKKCENPKIYEFWECSRYRENPRNFEKNLIRKSFGWIGFLFIQKKVILIILEIVLIGKCPSLVLTLEVKPLSVELPVKVRLGLESINIDNNWVVRRKCIHRGIWN